MREDKELQTPLNCQVTKLKPAATGESHAMAATGESHAMPGSGIKVP
jgi:hypothetical protein